MDDPLTNRDDDCDDQSINSLDERKGCRSLLCDANGIIIAEMVYRCMICYSVHDFIGDVSKHYHSTHMSGEDQENAIKEEDPHSNNNYLTNNNDFSNSFDETPIWQLEPKFSPYNGKLKPSHSITPHQKVSNASSESCTKSGYITCPVCSTIRCYTTLQRRYGQFTCVACYRFFKEFFIKPVKFQCPYLGSCPLDVKNKCKACWIYACIKVYTVDGRRKSILDAHNPVKSSLKQSPANQIGSDPNSPLYSMDYPKQNKNNGLSTSRNNDVNSINLQSLKEMDYDNVPLMLTYHNANGSLASQDTEDDIEKEMNDNEKLGDEANGYEVINSVEMKEPFTNGKCVVKKGERRSKARVKNWCCLKCANCLADDCGKCINCLDRPKFGGPFIRKQRCVNKKCLEKLHSDAK